MRASTFVLLGSLWMMGLGCDSSSQTSTTSNSDSEDGSSDASGVTSGASMTSGSGATGTATSTSGGTEAPSSATTGAGQTGTSSGGTGGNGQGGDGGGGAQNGSGGSGGGSGGSGQGGGSTQPCTDLVNSAPDTTCVNLTDPPSPLGGDIQPGLYHKVESRPFNGCPASPLGYPATLRLRKLSATQYEAEHVVVVLYVNGSPSATDRRLEEWTVDGTAVRRNVTCKIYELSDKTYEFSAASDELSMSWLYNGFFSHERWVRVGD